MKQSRLDYIAEILSAEGVKVTEGEVLPLTEARLRKAGLYDEVANVFRKLGGEGPVPLPEVKCDLKVADIPFFLDTDLHFNRYRLITLRADFYSVWTAFPLEKYRRFCRMYEKECLKAGQRSGIWSNDQAEKFFGEASAAGDFFANGAPGWKLRAFKDLLQDASVLLIDRQPIRVPVYEQALTSGKLVKLQKLFESRNQQSTEVLQKFLIRQLELKM
jgi:hypothetical protein